MLHFTIICYLLFVIYYLLFIICYLLFVIYYLLFIICYLLFIIMLEDAERRDMSEIHKRIADKYRRLATEDVLRSSRLALSDLLQLTDLPARLIFNLYFHHCVLTQSVGSRVTCEPGVCSAATPSS